MPINQVSSAGWSLCANTRVRVSAFCLRVESDRRFVSAKAGVFALFFAGLAHYSYCRIFSNTASWDVRASARNLTPFLQGSPGQGIPLVCCTFCLARGLLGCVAADQRVFVRVFCHAARVFTFIDKGKRAKHSLYKIVAGFVRILRIAQSLNDFVWHGLSPSEGRVGMRN